MELLKEEYERSERAKARKQARERAHPVVSSTHSLSSIQVTITALLRLIHADRHRIRLCNGVMNGLEFITDPHPISITSILTSGGRESVSESVSVNELQGFRVALCRIFYSDAYTLV